MLYINLFKNKKLYKLMVKDTLLYDKLEVSPTATTAEILKSYRKLALKYHPDRNPNDETANAKLMEINQAKEILTDDKKRRLYDQIGMDILSNGASQPQMNPEDLFEMFGAGFPGGGFPGGGFPGGGFPGGGFPGGGFPGANFNFSHGFPGHRQAKTENIVINQEVTLEEIYNEANISINFQQKIVCSACDGNTSICTVCNGQGVRIQIKQMGPMIQQMHVPCNECHGSGKIKSTNPCKTCSGEGHKLKDVKINIPLKNGLSNGQQIQIPNHGHHTKEGKGDLVIIIHEKPHKYFKRSGNDLIIEVELKLFQAIYGFDKVIDHLDNRKLYISHSGKTEYEDIRKISGEGMGIINSGGQKGDLIIKFNIVLPNLSNQDVKNKLLYLLKTIDNEESNNEVIVKNSKDKYVKTQMITVENNPFTNNQPQNDPPKQQQQCVHQ